MANFKQFDERAETAGPGRIGVTPTVIVADPGDMADIMTVADFEFVAPFEDVGATDGGIAVSKGFEETGYRVDQSEADFKTENTGHSLTVTTNLAATGDIETFVLAWVLPTATTIVAGPPEGRKKGLAAKRIVPRRSVAVMEIDEEDKLRSYFIRDMGNAAGDSAINLAPGALHVIAMTLRGFTKSAAADEEFGFIIEDDGFGGFDNA
jgi:hypothetical protein